MADHVTAITTRLIRGRRHAPTVSAIFSGRAVAEVDADAALVGEAVSEAGEEADDADERALAAVGAPAAHADALVHGDKEAAAVAAGAEVADELAAVAVHEDDAVPEDMRVFHGVLRRRARGRARRRRRRRTRLLQRRRRAGGCQVR